MYRRGLGRPEDAKLEIKFLREAAVEGYAKAQRVYGTLSSCLEIHPQAHTHTYTHTHARTHDTQRSAMYLLHAGDLLLNACEDDDQLSLAISLLQDAADEVRPWHVM